MNRFIDAATSLLNETRYITKEEAEAAAAVLLACNGCDLRAWSNDELEGEALESLGSDFLRDARKNAKGVREI